MPADPVVVPPRFAGFALRNPDWASWLDALPRLVADILGEWRLQVDGAAVHGQAALVVPVRTATGEPAVVKFCWPHPEAEHEHLALKAWAGRGAVRLLRADPPRSVLLLERARTDRSLMSVEVRAACEVVAGLYADLHRPALPQLSRLSVEGARWADELKSLHGHPAVPRRFVDAAAAAARTFAGDPATDGVLIHTDLHYENVLAAERGSGDEWLVIDPKPLSGEPAYEVAPLLWNRWEEAVATGNLRAALLNRFFAVVDAASLDEERARAWVLVRELVNVKWELDDPSNGQVPDADWITTAVTIAKAIQP